MLRAASRFRRRADVTIEDIESRAPRRLSRLMPPLTSIALLHARHAIDAAVAAATPPRRAVTPHTTDRGEAAPGFSRPTPRHAAADTPRLPLHADAVIFTHTIDD